MSSLCLRETFNQLDTGTGWRAGGDGSDNKEVAHPRIRVQCTLNEVGAAEAVERRRSCCYGDDLSLDLLASALI